MKFAVAALIGLVAAQEETQIPEELQSIVDSERGTRYLDGKCYMKALMVEKFAAHEFKCGHDMEAKKLTAQMGKDWINYCKFTPYRRKHVVAMDCDREAARQFWTDAMKDKKFLDYKRKELNEDRVFEDTIGKYFYMVGKECQIHKDEADKYEDDAEPFVLPDLEHMEETEWPHPHPHPDPEVRTQYLDPKCFMKAVKAGKFIKMEMKEETDKGAVELTMKMFGDLKNSCSFKWDREKHAVREDCKAHDKQLWTDIFADAKYLRRNDCEKQDLKLEFSLKYLFDTLVHECPIRDHPHEETEAFLQ